MKTIPEQLSFDILEPAPKANDSLFFAILPTPDAQASIGRQAGLLCNEHRLSGSPQARERLHVSLVNIGRYAGVPKAVVDAARAAAASVAIAPFELAFHRAMSFRRPTGRPLVLTSDDGALGAMALERTLGAALQKVRLAKPDPKFLPHVTMLYDDTAVPEQTIEPIAWTVSEFVLIHSLIGQTRYEVLGRWPLLP